MHEVGQYYWAKTADIPNIQVGEWQIALYTKNGWLVCGYDSPINHPYFEDIGEKVICPYLRLPANA